MGNAATTPAGWLWGPCSRLGLLVALIALVTDQAHKWWMLLGYRIQDKGRVRITPFLDLVFVKNTGISYSWFDGKSYGWQLGLALFAVAASAGLAVWLARSATGKLMAVSIGLIIGGAIGNAIDRVLLQGVADFFSLHAFNFYWYVFNIADVAIVAGVMGLLYESLGQRRNDAKNLL